MYVLTVWSFDEGKRRYFGPFKSEESAQRFFKKSFKALRYSCLVYPLFESTDSGLEEFRKDPS